MQLGELLGAVLDDEAIGHRLHDALLIGQENKGRKQRKQGADVDFLRES